MASDRNDHAATVQRCGHAQPRVVQPAGQQRAHAERERHRHADVAEVQQRRVDGHQEWFCSSGFGPGPSIGTGDTRPNGLAGPTSSM
jgi:hypothetical protein